MPRILIADTDSYSLPSYDVAWANDGPSCLKKLEEKPDLFIAALHLPKMHGIELLKIARQKKIPCILLSDYPNAQTHQIALTLGAQYVLSKPISSDELKKTIDAFFAGTLKPAPFSGPTAHLSQTPTLATLPQKRPASYLKLWGTRGSTPVISPRFGGHTACLEIRTPKSLVLIDAGTGIQTLGRELLAEPPSHYNLFLSHTHWDHLAGFPFFAPLYHTDATFDIWTPVGYTENAREVFAEIFSDSLFPVSFDRIAPRITFHEMRSGDSIQVEDVQIQVAYALHPGSTLCFKISACGKQIGYATDNEVLVGHTHDAVSSELWSPHRSLIELLHRSDLLIHEAQYLDEEYPERIGWGHSSVSNATLLAREIEPKEWIITHHNPRHSDEDLLKKLIAHETLAKRLGLHCPIHMASDGMVIPL